MGTQSTKKHLKLASIVNFTFLRNDTPYKKQGQT
jgi:hypothetical protein